VVLTAVGMCFALILLSSWVSKYLRLVPHPLELQPILVFLKWDSSCPVAGNFIFLIEMSTPKCLALTMALLISIMENLRLAGFLVKANLY
jgi:hypothetical protein